MTCLTYWATDEQCTKPSGIASDEDCDGGIDEDCDCEVGAKLPCYAGPAGTVGEGACQLGLVTCNDQNEWGECKGQVVPKPETCLNLGQDDDCEILMNICDNMMGKTICVFADAAAMPTQAIVRKFRNEFDDHISQGRCTLPEARD